MKPSNPKPAEQQPEVITRNDVIKILKSSEETAHRNVGKGCNYETYLLPYEYPIIARKVLELFKEWHNKLSTPGGKPLEVVEAAKEAADKMVERWEKQKGIVEWHEVKRELENLFIAGTQWSSGGWVSVNGDNFVFPEKEGKYLCCNAVYLQSEEAYSYSYLVSNFKFYKMRETKEKVIGADGETGCFVSNAGYADSVTHWVPLPAPPITRKGKGEQE